MQKLTKLEITLINPKSKQDLNLNEIMSQIDSDKSKTSISYEFTEHDRVNKIIFSFQSKNDSERLKDYLEIEGNMKRYNFEKIEISQIEVELNRRFSSSSTDSFQLINEDKSLEMIETIVGDGFSYQYMDESVTSESSDNTNNFVEFYFDKEVRDHHLDIILLFLENLRNSGGGDYIDYSLDQSKRLLKIEYKHFMNKAKVLYKKLLKIKIGSIEYNITANELLNFDSFKLNNSVIILSNIDESWHTDNILILYAENLVVNDDDTNDVAKIIKSLIFPRTVYVKYKHPFNKELLDKRYEKKKFINNTKIEFENAFISKIILVRLFDKNNNPVSKDLIEMYFANKRRCGSDSYESIHEREPFLLLTYSSQEICENICSRVHKIGDFELVVECLYNYELFDKIIQDLRDKNNNLMQNKENGEDQKSRIKKGKKNKELKETKIDQIQKQDQNKELKETKIDQDQKQDQNKELKETKVDQDQKQDQNKELKETKVDQDQKQDQDKELKETKVDQDQKQDQNEKLNEAKIDQNQNRKENENSKDANFVQNKNQKNEIENKTFESKEEKTKKKLEFRKPNYKINSAAEPKIKLLKYFDNSLENYLSSELKERHSSLELKVINDSLELFCECTHDLPSNFVQFKQIKQKWELETENFIKSFFEKFTIDTIMIKYPNNVVNKINFDKSKVSLTKIDDLEQNSWFEVTGFADDVLKLIADIKLNDEFIPPETPIDFSIEKLSLEQIRILFVVKYISKLKLKYPSLEVIINHKKLRVDLKGLPSEIKQAEKMCKQILDEIKHIDAPFGEKEIKFFVHNEHDVVDSLKEEKIECVLMPNQEKNFVRIYYIEPDQVKKCVNELRNNIITNEIGQELTEGISDSYIDEFVASHSNDKRVYLEKENGIIYISGFKQNVVDLFQEFLSSITN